MDHFSERSKHFHESFNLSSYKDRRGDHEVELRKNKRSNDACKRRSLHEPKQWVELGLHFKALYTLDDLPELIEAAKSANDMDALRAAQGFRKLLSLSPESPIQTAIDSGIVPLLVNWIQRSDFPQIQYEAA